MEKSKYAEYSEDKEVDIMGDSASVSALSDKAYLQPDVKEDPQLMVNSHPRAITMRDELLGTIRGSNLDTVKASNILWNHYVEETYDPMEYQKFLCDVRLARISYFDAGAPLFHPEIYEHPQAEMLIDLRNMIKNDITLSLSSITSPITMDTPRSKRARVQNEIPQFRCDDELTFTKARLDNTHIIPEDDIFRGLNLREFLFSTWREPSPATNAYHKLKKATKHILAHICKVPEDITNYTHSKWGGTSRKFENLPDHILKTLGGMMVQVTGLDNPLYDVNDDEHAKQEYPENWAALGSDDKSRSKELVLMRNLKDKFASIQDTIIADNLTDLRRCDFTAMGASERVEPRRKRSSH